MILESLDLGHTEVVQTPYIHIGISEVVGIVPLLHSLHVHFSCVLCSPCI